MIGHGDKFCPVAFEKPVVGREKPFGSWLRAGGKRVPTVPANRWLVLDPSTVESTPVGLIAGSVTVPLDDSLQQHSMVEKGVSAVTNDKGIMSEVYYGAHNEGNYGHNDESFNDESEGEGVVVVEQKRKRVGYEQGVRGGCVEGSSPMLVEGQFSNATDEVGPDSQAYRAK